MSILDNISSAFADLNEVAEQNTLISHPENIASNLLLDNPDNIFSANDTDEEIAELAKSIESMGLIHRPAVSAQADGTYLILSGHRRIRAMRDNLGYETIPCQVYDNLSPDIEALIVYDANFVVRDNMTAEDKLIAYEIYAEKLKSMKGSGEIDNLAGFTGSVQKYIAMRLGVSERTIRRLKKLSENLTDEEKEKIKSGEMTLADGKQAIEERKEKAKAKKKEYSPEQLEALQEGKLIYLTQKKKDNGFACECPKSEVYEKLAYYEDVGSWEFFEFLVHKYGNEKYSDEYEKFLRSEYNYHKDTEETGNDI